MKPVASVVGIFFVGVGLVTLIAISSAKSGQDKPTQIQVGVMTEKEKVHSKLFKALSAGRKLDVPLPERRLGKDTVDATEETVYLEPGITVTSPDVPVPSFVEFLKDLSCDADAIVIASAKGRSSQLTENREFLFSDYVVTVEEVLKNNPSANIDLGRDKTVTRPGGRVQVKGRVINAVDASFKPLEMAKRYLLFLIYIPESDAYKSIRKGSFLIQGDNLIVLTEEAIPGGPGESRAFTQEVRNAASSACSKDK